MGKFLTLDCHCYEDSRYNLRKRSIPEFVADPRFHLLGLAVGYPDGACLFHTNPVACLDSLRQAYGAELERITVLCHDAMLQLYIIWKKFGLHPRYFLDTRMLANHVHPGKTRDGALSALARLHDLPFEERPVTLEGVRKLNARQSASLGDYAKHRVQTIRQLAQRLLPRLGNPKVEIPLMMQTARLFTRGGIRVDMERVERLQRGIHEELQTSLAAAGVSEKLCACDQRFHEHLQKTLAAVGRTTPFSPGKDGRLPSLAKDDPQMQALLRDPVPAVAALARARLQKKSADQQLSRLQTLANLARAGAGELSPHLVYCGAHTGRFSGGGGFNLQNLPHEGMGSEIRKLLIPRPGHRFLIADYCQIEARVLAHFSDQYDLLAAYREGRDIYSEFASEVFGMEVRKPRPEDSAEEAMRLTALRQVGKMAVLGLGYGMGAERFSEQLRAEPAIQPLFTSGQLTDAKIAAIVNSFRARYPRIPEFVQYCEQCFTDCLDQGGVHGAYAKDGLNIRLSLPSGRCIQYVDVRKTQRLMERTRMDEYGSRFAGVHERTVLLHNGESEVYGGLLVENAVQAAARDILAEALLALEIAGYTPLFHIHDEVVLEVPEQDTTRAETEVARIMSTPAKWCKDLPLAVEVRTTCGYGYA